MIEEDNSIDLDEILDEMIRPPPQTTLVEIPESNIQFNGKQKVLSVEEIREHAPIICGCSPEEHDRKVARERLMDGSKTILEFEKRKKKFDEQYEKLLGLTPRK